MKLTGIHRAAGGSASWGSHPRMVLMRLPSLLEAVTGQKYHYTLLLFIAITVTAGHRPNLIMHGVDPALDQNGRGRFPLLQKLHCLSTMGIRFMLISFALLRPQAQKGMYPIYWYSVFNEQVRFEIFVPS